MILQDLSRQLTADLMTQEIHQTRDLVSSIQPDQSVQITSCHQTTQDTHTTLTSQKDQRTASHSIHGSHMNHRDQKDQQTDVLTIQDILTTHESLKII